MKTLKLLLLCAVGCAVGCERIDRALYDAEVREVPGGVVSTNTTYETNDTVVTPVVVYEYAPTRYETNLVAKPMVEDAIGLAGAAPVPWAGMAAALAGLAYSTYRNVRNRKTAVAVVDGIGEFKRILEETRGAVGGVEGVALLTETLKRAQVRDGVWVEVIEIMDDLAARTK